MQTFLPLPSFTESAAVLDNRRLGNQRGDVLQVLRALDGRDTSVRLETHKLVRMWRGYPEALIEYGLAVCNEWIKRGFQDNCRDKMIEFKISGLFVRWWIVKPDPLSLDDVTPDKYPSWLGDPAVHASHRSNLLRKSPSHYRPIWPHESDKLPYVWPMPMLPAAHRG